MITSESIAKLAPALLTAQRAIQAAAKKSENDHFHSKYADLATVIEAVKGALNEAGVVFLQSLDNNQDGVCVITRLQHESGEWAESRCYIPVPQKTPQAYGSAITYGKRYGLQSFVGLPSEDDDGNAGSAPAKEPKAEKEPEPKRKGMPNKEFIDHCTNMSDASKTGDLELKKAFSAAYRAAEAYGDMAAMKSLTEKKDQLKLTTPTPALAEQA